MKRIALITYLSFIICQLSISQAQTISLLTCEPGKEEVYTLFGHTAIRVQDPEKNIDIVVNYGLFDPHAPNFIINFILGKTDYYAGATTYETFCQTYRHEGRNIHEQVLRLTPEETANIINTLNNNLTPPNNTYRYNIFYKNCTTLAKDAIWNNLKPQTPNLKPQTSNTTIRSLIDQYTQPYPWLQFGINLILGVKADKTLTPEQQLFLPIELMNAVQDSKLTATTTQREPHRENHAERTTIITPLIASIILLIIAISVSIPTFSKSRHSRAAAVFDSLLIITTTVASLILILFAFSEHPTTTLNLLLLMLNPIPATILWQTIRGRKTKFGKRIWTLWAAMTIACLCGAVIQTYPIPIFFIAATILVRALCHTFFSYSEESSAPPKKGVTSRAALGIKRKPAFFVLLSSCTDFVTCNC